MQRRGKLAGIGWAVLLAIALIWQSLIVHTHVHNANGPNAIAWSTNVVASSGPSDRSPAQPSSKCVLCDELDSGDAWLIPPKPVLVGAKLADLLAVEPDQSTWSLARRANPWRSRAPPLTA